MNSPVFEEENKNKNTGKIIPLYPLTYNLSQNVIRQIIENGLREVNNSLEETLPKYLLEEYNLDDINKATKNVNDIAKIFLNIIKTSIYKNKS